MIRGSGSSVGEGIGYPLQYSWTSLVAQRVKNPPTMWETWVRSLLFCLGFFLLNVVITSDSPRQKYWSGLPCPPPGHLPNPGIKPRSPALQAVSLLSEPPGKSKNTGVGSLSLLQGIFPTQESNWGLLHCRQILYQLSYQGSPFSAPPPLLLLLLLLSRVSCVRLCATP